VNIMSEDDLGNEVRFWEYMLEDWEDNNDEPPPERMYEALELARSKLKLMGAKYAYEGLQVH